MTSAFAEVELVYELSPEVERAFSAKPKTRLRVRKWASSSRNIVFWGVSRASRQVSESSQSVKRLGTPQKPSRRGRFGRCAAPDSADAPHSDGRRIQMRSSVGAKSGCRDPDEIVLEVLVAV